MICCYVACVCTAGDIVFIGLWVVVRFFFLNYVVKLLSFCWSIFVRESSVGARIGVGAVCRYASWVCVVVVRCFHVI